MADAGGGAVAKRTKLSAVDPYPGNIDRNRMALKASNKLREYLDLMSPKDLERYEHFRRSSFKHDTVKQLMLRTIKTTYVCPLFLRVSTTASAVTHHGPSGPCVQLTDASGFARNGP
jgi:hypothetical protein